MRSWKFLVPAMLAVALFCLLVRLGFWQLSRAEYKERIQQQSIQNRDLEVVNLNDGGLQDSEPGWFYRPASGVGHYDREHEFLLDNRTHAGRAGYHVLTPFDLGHGTVLVNRGWLPLGQSREVPPDTKPVPGNSTTVTGILSTPPRPGLILGPTGHDADGAWPRIVQTADLPAMARALGRPLLPPLLLLDPDSPQCHVCEWVPVVGMGPETHRGYAFQWFALALALLVLCTYVVARSRRRG